MATLGNAADQAAGTAAKGTRGGPQRPLFTGGVEGKGVDGEGKRAERYGVHLEALPQFLGPIDEGGVERWEVRPGSPRGLPLAQGLENSWRRSTSSGKRTRDEAAAKWRHAASGSVVLSEDLLNRRRADWPEWATQAVACTGVENSFVITMLKGLR